MQRIDEAIIDYLQYEGLDNVVDLFKEERRSHAFNIGINNRKRKQINEVVKAFDNGDRNATIALWNEFLPNHPPPKLGFYIHVYFAIYPILHEMDGSRTSTSMKEFSHFLEEYSKRVDVAPECLPFYALPFVSDPKVHESFMHLFKESWVEELQLEYIGFLEDNIRVKQPKVPLLIQMFKDNMPISDKKTDMHIIDQQEGSSEPETSTYSILQPGSYPVKNLDIARISNVLCSHVSEFRKAELLQALRWNLTQSQPHSIRRAVLEEYIDNDLFHCADIRGSYEQKGALLTCLLESSDDIVKDSALRLISALANYYSGRSYLLQDPNLTKLLCSTMMNNSDVNSDIHLNSLCILQKFSMRRVPESQMIDFGVVEYIGKVLSKFRQLSEEAVEFATALLFNLSLRTNGKISFENSEVDMVSLLIDLLEVRSAEVRHFVCGTFISILSRSKLKQRAQMLNAVSAFKYTSIDTEETQQQIAAILDQLHSSSNAGPSDEDEENWTSSDQEDDDPDYIPAEEEDITLTEQFQEDLADELCDITGGGLRGAQLLSVQYVINSGLPVKRQLDYSNRMKI